MKHGVFEDFKVFTGNSNPELAEEIAAIMGKPIGQSTVEKFSDCEISVSLWETVRGLDVFIVQPTCGNVNDTLMELLIMADAMKRASAGRINAVIPYYGYARQDRKAKARDPITAKLVADLLTAAGIDRVISMDLHASQIQGYFNIPVDHLLGIPILVKYFRKRKLEDLVIVSPDHGSVVRARNMAQPLNAPIAIVDKRRPRANVSEVMNIIGDIEGKTCLLVDDMIDTAGTITNAAHALKKYGAKSIYACATHGILSGPAMDRIANSPIEEMVLLNTVPIDPAKCIDKIKLLSVAPLFAEAMARIFSNDSISGLFGNK
ncbi:MAG: ribose-phosphate pyrophosphokinase [Clostridiales Family XIII bacterium]|jgi:ribose-phosphate pyrophosphokinase|nr:ribose-phosphate pyrophosphokinase [Clostridiales Family XIII bacterium]